MRKPEFSRTILTLALGIGILALILSFGNKAYSNTCNVKVDCPEKIEDIKGSELLWESLSRQFVGSVSVY